MTSVAFDTGLAIENLQQQGFDLTQSRGIVDVIKTAQTELATKHDLEHAIELLRRDMAVQKRDLIIWLGGVVIAAIGILFTLLQLFPPGSLG